MNSKRNFVTLLTRGLYFIWSLLLIIILSIIVERIYAHAKHIAIKEAQTSVNKDLAYRSWIASHGGVYVPVDKRTQPSKYLKHLQNRDFEVSGKKYTLINPAYTLSQMMHDYSKLYGIKTHITSNKILNPANKPDAWETLALNEVGQSRQNFKELSYINDVEYLRLMKPLITKKTCLKCHAVQGHKIGDILGGVSISIPMAVLYEEALKSSLYILGLFSLIWSVGAFSISIFSKKLSKYINEKETLYEEYIYGLVGVVEKRDTYTAGHSSRVADYAELIAKKMQYSESDQHILHRAGMLHDIGKVAIPDSVFLKPSKLSRNEYKLIQQHATISYEMLENISLFDDIKEIVRDHHEHYDGSGYPRGQLGDDTPMLAQILTLADSFDAMTTDRIYKGRKSVKEALLEIAKLSGKQFNPKIVQVALVALKDVIIDHTQHQNPETLLEKERFSYFYKDALTNVFNEGYLRLEIKNIFITEKIVGWLSLNNFHAYNKAKGWSEGDALLRELGDMIKTDATQVYRFYGDNFLIVLDAKDDFTLLKDQIDALLSQKKVGYKLKMSNADATQENSVESLEDVLKKLF